MSTVTLRDNQAAFDAALPELLAEPENVGKWAVFHNRQLWGIFDQQPEAHAAALAEFGYDAVLLVAPIKQPRAEPISLAYDLGLLFGEA